MRFDRDLMRRRSRVVVWLLAALVLSTPGLLRAQTLGDVGNAIQQPMAVVILGGLLTSTLLNLFVMPALCLSFAKSTKGKAV